MKGWGSVVLLINTGHSRFVKHLRHGDVILKCRRMWVYTSRQAAIILGVERTQSVANVCIQMESM